MISILRCFGKDAIKQRSLFTPQRRWLTTKPEKQSTTIDAGLPLTLRVMERGDIKNVTNLLYTSRVLNVDFSPADMEIAFDENMYGYICEHNGVIIGFCGFRKLGYTKKQTEVLTVSHMTVKNEYRNMGLSQMIAQRARHDLGKPNVVCLGYGDNEQSQIIESWTGKLDRNFGTFKRVLGKFQSGTSLPNCSVEHPIKLADKQHFDALADFDTKVHFLPRAAFLERLCFHPLSKTYIVTDEGSVAGYCVLTKSFRGYRLAPCFANTPDIANALLHQVINDIPRDQVVSFTYDTNNSLVENIVEENNFQHVITIHSAIVYGKDPGVRSQVDRQRIYMLSNVKYSLT